MSTVRGSTQSQSDREQNETALLSLEGVLLSFILPLVLLAIFVFWRRHRQRSWVCPAVHAVTVTKDKASPGRNENTSTPDTCNHPIPEDDPITDQIWILNDIANRRTPAIPGPVRDLTATVDPRTASVRLQWLPPEVEAEMVMGYYVRFKPICGKEYSNWSMDATERCLDICREFMEPLKLLRFEIRAANAGAKWSSVDRFIDWHCRLPGCSNSRLLDEDRKEIYDWCSTQHFEEFADLHCLFPECTALKQRLVKDVYSPRGENVEDEFCGPQHYRDAVQMGFSALVKVQSHSDEFECVQDIFQRNWVKKKGACPHINTILRVINPGTTERFKKYRNTLPPGSRKVEMYFHGTALSCLITKFYELCNEPFCGVCGIAKRGFDLSRVRADRWQRFGPGIYLAPNSSKSSDYPLHRGLDADGMLQALFLCVVAPGNKKVVRTNQTQLRSPPEGKHSVHAKAKVLGVFGDLNYPELAVYNADAVLPAYVICYYRSETQGASDRES